MTSKLSKQKREEIIINHIKGTPDPHYIVTESKAGRYTVKMKPFEIEEDEDEEVEAEEEDDIEVEQPTSQREQPTPRPKKQNARKLLEQLASMISDDEEEPQRSQHGWNRRRLRF